MQRQFGCGDLQDTNGKYKEQPNFGSTADLKRVANAAGKTDDHHVATDACYSVGIPEGCGIDALANNTTGLIPYIPDRNALSDRGEYASYGIGYNVCHDAVVTEAKPPGGTLREDVEVEDQERNFGQADDDLVKDLSQPEHLCSCKYVSQLDFILSSLPEEQSFRHWGPVYHQDYRSRNRPLHEIRRLVYGISHSILDLQTTVMEAMTISKNCFSWLAYFFPR